MTQIIRETVYEILRINEGKETKFSEETTFDEEKIVNGITRREYEGINKILRSKIREDVRKYNENFVKKT